MDIVRRKLILVTIGTERVKGSFSVMGKVTGIKMACMLIISLTSSVSSHLWEPEVHPSCFKNSSKSVVLFRQQDQNLYLKIEQK